MTVMVKRKFMASTSALRRAVRPRGKFTVKRSLSKSRVRRGKGKFTKAISQHVYSRYADTPASIDVTGVEYGKGEAFTFDSIRAYNEFSALYDRYRITCVQMQITLVTNPSSTWSTNDPLTAGAKAQTTNWFPKFWYVKDYDDASAPSLASMRERSNVKNFVLRPNKTFKLNIRPAILNQTYRTLTSTGYSPHWKQWIDMQQTDVPHYGLKWVLDTQGLDPNDILPFKLRIEYKYFFTCKDVL